MPKFEISFKKSLDILNYLKGEGLVIDYALIGGVAVNLWGRNRDTDDIDFLVSVFDVEDLSTIETSLKLINGVTDVAFYKGGLTDPIPYLIRFYVFDIKIEFIIAVRTYEFEAIAYQVEGNIGDLSFSLVPIEYLLILKLRANGYQDRADIEHLLAIQKDIDKLLLLQLAKRFRVDKNLKKFLK